MTIDPRTASFAVSSGRVLIEAGNETFSFSLEQYPLFAENLDLAVFLNQELDWTSYVQNKALWTREVR